MPGRHADKRIERFADGGDVPAFSGCSRQAYMRLAIVRNASHLRALAANKGNRPEALHGGPEGQYPICINDQWRVCFTWDERKWAAFNRETVDHH